MTDFIETPDETLTAARKADFGSIYAGPDPRAYFRTLCSLDYQVPAVALPLIESVLRDRRADRAAPPAEHPAVLDVCCSYGINAALLSTSIGWDELSGRYLDPRLDSLEPDELLEADKSLYAERARDGVRVFGLDSSAPAIGYARDAGLLSDGWAEDLESGQPSQELVDGLRSVDTVVSTGGVGYITERTFSRLLDAHPAPETLWLVICVLRVFDYAPIAAALRRYGLVTERLPDTLRQRRFADEQEAAAAVDDVRARGLDPAGKELDGWFHADCYLSRPR